MTIPLLPTELSTVTTYFLLVIGFNTLLPILAHFLFAKEATTPRITTFYALTILYTAFKLLGGLWVSYSFWLTNEHTTEVFVGTFIPLIAPFLFTFKVKLEVEKGTLTIKG